MSIKQQEIILYENKIDFRSILESKEPSVMLLAKENYEQLFNHVVAVATNYFQICHPSLLHLAPVIASDLIRNNPSWKAADFINMFRYFRTSPTDTNLNMTYERLINRVTEYELSRTQALEAHHAKNKGTLSEQNKKLNDVAQSVAKRLEEKNGKYEHKDELMGKEFDKVQAERERTGKNVIYRSETPDEKFFEQSKIEKNAK